VKNRAKPLAGANDLLACLDHQLNKAIANGLTLDPELNPGGKWSVIIRARREIEENRAEIKRLRTLLRLAGIAYTKQGPAIYDAAITHPDKT
jgi:hypothetical protein